eukprot:evm.model.scf_3834EXC.1 EVM.evm.TU.scf_3834EXC.1   scf_3834EXC:575-5508(+)
MGGQKSGKQVGEVPKLLATLAGHTLGVSTVRFSSDGQYIASGADDALVIIYSLAPGRGQGILGSLGASNYENWQQTQLFRFHQTNVTDLTWAPANSARNQLATCSLDNQIAVWSIEDSKPVAILKGHTSFVKGVAWDPMGVYLASQADDRCVIIWRTSDWKEAQRITSPLAQQPTNNCFFYRLCWSPDGQMLTIVNSLQNGACAACAIKRGTWSQEYSMVGHFGAITVARYCPKLFAWRGLVGAHEIANCVVLGSVDRGYSLWLSVKQQPVHFAKGCFRGSVTDVAWAPDGWTFLVASTDGTVAVTSFHEQVLGSHAPDEEVTSHMKELYGDLNSGRRIKPVENVEQASAEEGRDSLPAKCTSCNEQVTHPPGRVLDGVEVGSTSVSEPQKWPATMTGRQGHSKLPLQQEGRTADGRRKIHPVPVVPSITSVGNENGGRETLQGRAFSQPGSPKGKPSTPSERLKRSRDGVPCTPQSKCPRLVSAVAPAIGGTSVTAKTAQNGQSGTDLQRLKVAAAALPPKKTTFPLKSGGQGICDALDDAEVTVQVSNGERISGGKEYAQIVCRRGPRTAWVAEVVGKVALVTGSPRFCAIATVEGDLQVFSESGTRDFPSIRLGERPSFLDSDGEWMLLSLTCHGQLRVWDLGKAECIVETSLFGLLSENTQVVAAYLSKCGLPLCVLSNYHAYLYKVDMKCWMRIVDDSFPFSHYHTMFKWSSHSDDSSGELINLQIGRAQHQRQPSRLPAMDGRSSDLDSRSHLEHNMAAAQALQSPHEYKRWLLVYIRHLVKCVGTPEMKGDEESKLREICEDLLGPMGEASKGEVPVLNGRQWLPDVLGMDKRKILKTDVRGILCRNRDLQRLRDEIESMLNDS